MPSNEALEVAAPITGRVVPLSSVPDPVFAGQLVGAGAAIEPAPGVFEVLSPAEGKIIKLLPHAFVIVDTAGRGVLVHVGIDTVKLAGEGFTILAKKDDWVHAGSPIMRVDPAPALAAGYSLVSPVVVLDSKPDTVSTTATGEVRGGARLFAWSPEHEAAR
ncbi:PTS glucose transporter subunit IIA [Paenarthrobacter sp. S56]|uniref:PTS sugar transporter subunit IIA n=1 Tax=Paenarthrobacter sp. S56 TaxID=3138179 RepID=UPI00321B7762